MPTLLVVDDADLRTGLISALVGYLRWDDAGPPVRLLLRGDPPAIHALVAASAHAAAHRHDH